MLDRGVTWRRLLEGRRTGALTGPMTFGEIAYQLLNQTMVYLRIA